MQYSSPICKSHKVSFAECPENCGYAYVFGERSKSVLRQEKKKRETQNLPPGPRLCLACSSPLGKWRKRFCSYKCQQKHAKLLVPRYVPVPKSCIRCGNPVRKWGTLFCSDLCQQETAKLHRPPPKPRVLKVCYCVQCGGAIPREEGKFYGGKTLCSPACKKEWQESRRKPPTPRDRRKIRDPRDCAMCGKPVVPPRKTHCSLACGIKHSSYLSKFKEKEEIRKKRAAFQPKQRVCPRCGKEVWTSFEVPNRKFCSRPCAKRSSRSALRRNRIARGDRSHLVKQALSGRIREILKRNHSIKCFATIKYLGCTATKLREHLESQFTDGMDWSNYGVLGWHVDHILPCAVFDFTRRDHQMICFNFRNLRPLWYHENLSKADTVDTDVLLAADFHLLKEARRLGVKV